MADALPSRRRIIRAVGIIAHVFHTPLDAAWGMTLADIEVWAGEAWRLLERLRGRG